MNSTIAFGQNYKYENGKKTVKVEETKSTVASSFFSKATNSKTEKSKESPKKSTAKKSEAQEVVKSIEKVLKQGPFE